MLKLRGNILYPTLKRGQHVLHTIVNMQNQSARTTCKRKGGHMQNSVDTAPRRTMRTQLKKPRKPVEL